MKPINIYMLTRVNQSQVLTRFERQMSHRDRFLPIREWEISGVREVAEQLFEQTGDSAYLWFYFSFQVPKIGKEFDLLQLTEESVVNIELKSEQVTDEKISRQLIQNRYYLNTIGKNVYSYTYISSEKRLVRLSRGDHLVEASFSELASLLMPKEKCLMGDIEDFFKEERYLISPLTDPERFLRKDYFLTSAQKDIRNKIFHAIAKLQGGEQHFCFQGFTGLPGTGKTLLLYDLAMQLSWKEMVCVLHFGSFPDELRRLDDRLKRIDFFPCGQLSELPDLTDYSYILVDEGHRLHFDELKKLVQIAQQTKKSIVFCYDTEDAISRDERGENVVDAIRALPLYQDYKLTNRIRTNAELSTFIQYLMCTSRGGASVLRRYPNVSFSYANSPKEVRVLLNEYLREHYVLIWDARFRKYWEMDAGITVGTDVKAHLDFGLQMTTDEATCREFDKVVMIVPPSFYYDSEGYLRSDLCGMQSPVRHLFHGLSRAKSKLALIVIQNRAVFEAILTITQGAGK